MKIAVVQTASTYHASSQSALDHCIKSVQCWSHLNGYTHCLVDQPDTAWSIFRSDKYNRGLRKWEVCASVADEFDHIIYLDADMLCWGNPQLPILPDHLCAFGKSEPPPHTHAWWDRRRVVHPYFYSAPSSIIKNIFQWIQDQNSAPTRCEGVVSDRYLEYNVSNWSETERGSYPHSLTFHDGSLLRHWIADNRSSVKLFNSQDWITDVHTASAMAPQKFFHFAGPHKDKQYAVIWSLIQAYKANQQQFNNWRDVLQLIYK